MQNFKISHILDENVSQRLDKQLIQSLTICFPHQPLFKTQRYYKELPRHRWYIEDNGKIAAHVAVHDKKITVNDEKLRIGGIAEVFVLPEYRKKGLAKRLLLEAEQWMKDNAIKFSLLYGEEKIYKSSGYHTIITGVKYMDFETKEWIEETSKDLMVKELISEKFSTGKIDLKGPTF